VTNLQIRATAGGKAESLDLDPLKDHLSERRAIALAGAVDHLRTAISAGSVPNTAFVTAKRVINLAVVEAVEAYRQKTGDFYFSAIISAHDLEGAHKSAKKEDQSQRASFFETLLPLRELLQRARPLIVKRSNPQKPDNLVGRGGQMTCQCCGRFVKANTGVIAAHGYRRPSGIGQTASCRGAHFLPFEVSRDRLGSLLVGLGNEEAGQVAEIAEIAAERSPLIYRIQDRSRSPGRYGWPTRQVEVTRANFDETRVICNLTIPIVSFDQVKERYIQGLERSLAALRQEISGQRSRFESWRQTYDWDDAVEGWRELSS
jgi:hypothetical protein